ncbi:MAG: DNA polymerase IV [Clostridia bacterium]|nr:DNA polymerase IV [Clostridia bacterium]
MPVILHADMNNFFASVECLSDPSLRDVPMAVCGSVEKRHGIVLAKNQLANAYGVKTGETVGDAKSKCPRLVIAEAHAEKYIKISKAVMSLFGEYTDFTEPFGIDECWLDISEYAGEDTAVGKAVADEIRKKISTDIGITASVGVSYNKIFAKMGSDYKKPDATTIITKKNYKDLLWPLPVSDLLFVGKSTAEKFHYCSIDTIGDLALRDACDIEKRFGKPGLSLWKYANGLDDSRVMRRDERVPPKSIGNSVTPARDMKTSDDVSAVLHILSDCVAFRLRAENMYFSVVKFSMRDTSLRITDKQIRIKRSCLSADIYAAAYALFRQNGYLPLRSIGVTVTDLTDTENEQLSLFNDEREQKQKRLEIASDGLKRRFGGLIVRPAAELTDPAFSALIPRDSPLQK